jgi:hypothetical protein
MKASEEPPGSRNPRNGVARGAWHGQLPAARPRPAGGLPVLEGQPPAPGGLLAISAVTFP